MVLCICLSVAYWSATGLTAPAVQAALTHYLATCLEIETESDDVILQVSSQTCDNDSSTIYKWSAKKENL